ncbi:hypothetical protein V6N12_068577 [Hibiscus sabdariffa]|uniref:DUF4283 domain-containing protein n=1 Tax=Hibiscus sabdariffa TaxID=183260 RepID=A0ABR2FQJ2_9ROSI
MSYKDTLIGDSIGGDMQEDENFNDDDIEILKVVLKLLSWHIGYTTLKNKILDLLKPKREIKLMDIENGYFLATFQSHEDYLNVLVDGPWTVFGHYLTVEPWSPDFSPTQPYPSKVIAWIWLPGLPDTLYKRSLIEEIGNYIGLVIHID